MRSKNTPLLTIGVSTFNRSAQLEILLENLCPQIEKFEKDIELVLCNNASTDDTGKVARAAKAHYPFIKYFENRSNLGFSGNIRLIARDLARGEYCWFIGDDEFVIAGGIATLLKALRRNRHVDYFYLNHGWISHTERDYCVRQRQSQYRGKSSQLRLAEDRLLTRWEELLLIPAKNPIAMFNGIFCQVLKTDHWNVHFERIPRCRHIDQDEYETCLDCVFPFAKIAARNGLGKPAYAISSPIVFQGMGIQDYFRYSAVHQTLGHHKLLEYFASLGVPAAIMQKVERKYFRYFGCHFLKYCEHDYSNKLKHHVYEYLRKMSESPFFWDSLQRAIRGQDNDEENVARHYRRNIFVQMVKHEIGKEKSLVVWGYGQLGQMVIADLGRLSRCIKAVVDVNKNIEGQPVPKTNVKIIQPGDLTGIGNVDVILIASTFHAKDIIRTIRDELKLDATIISVLGVSGSRKGNRSHEMACGSSHTRDAIGIAAAASSVTI
jgi:glycosyltransferase involved in cell wall biosynthesis